MCDACDLRRTPCAVVVLFALLGSLSGPPPRRRRPCLGFACLRCAVSVSMTFPHIIKLAQRVRKPDEVQQHERHEAACKQAPPLCGSNTRVTIVSLQFFGCILCCICGSGSALGDLNSPRGCSTHRLCWAQHPKCLAGPGAANNALRGWEGEGADSTLLSSYMPVPVHTVTTGLLPLHVLHVWAHPSAWSPVADRRPRRQRLPRQAVTQARPGCCHLPRATPAAGRQAAHCAARGTSSHQLPTRTVADAPYATTAPNGGATGRQPDCLREGHTRWAPRSGEGYH